MRRPIHLPVCSVQPWTYRVKYGLMLAVVAPLFACSHRSQVEEGVTKPPPTVEVTPPHRAIPVAPPERSQP